MTFPVLETAFLLGTSKVTTDPVASHKLPSPRPVKKHVNMLCACATRVLSPGTESATGHEGGSRRRDAPAAHTPAREIG